MPRSTRDRVAQIVLLPSTRAQKAKPKAVTPLPPTPPPLPTPTPESKRPKYIPVPEPPVAKEGKGSTATVVAVCILIFIIALVLMFQMPLQQEPNAAAPVVVKTAPSLEQAAALEQFPSPSNTVEEDNRLVNLSSPTPFAQEAPPSPTPEPPTPEPPTPEPPTPEPPTPTTPTVATLQDDSSQAIYKVTTNIPDGFLNMRIGPGVSNPVIQKLQGGLDGVTLVGQPQVNGETTWQQITSRGVTGWVNADFLSKNEPTQPSPTTVLTPQVVPAPAIYLPAITEGTPQTASPKNRTYRWRGQYHKVPQVTLDQLLLLQGNLQRAIDEYKQSVEVYNEAVKKYQRSGPAGKWKTSMMAAAKKTLLEEAQRRMKGAEASIDNTLAGVPHQ